MSWWQWALVGAAAVWGMGLWLARRPGNGAVVARVARSGSRFESVALSPVPSQTSTTGASREPGRPAAGFG